MSFISNINKLVPHLCVEEEQRAHQLEWFQLFVGSNEEVLRRTFECLRFLRAQDFIQRVDNLKSTPLQQDDADAHVHQRADLSEEGFELVSRLHLCSSVTFAELLNIFGETVDMSTFAELVRLSVVEETHIAEKRYFVPGYVFHIWGIRPSATAIDLWLKYYSGHILEVPPKSTCRWLLLDMQFLGSRQLVRLLNIYTAHYRQINLKETAKFLEEAKTRCSEAILEERAFLHSMSAAIFEELGWFRQALDELAVPRADVSLSHANAMAHWYHLTITFNVFDLEHCRKEVKIFIENIKPYIELLNPNYISSLSSWAEGRVAFAAGEFDRALSRWADTRRVAQLADETGTIDSADHGCAETYLQQREFAKARHIFERFIERGPTHNEYIFCAALTELGALCFEFGDRDLGGAYLEKAINYATSHHLIGFHLTALFYLAYWSDLDEGLSYLRQAETVNEHGAFHLGFIRNGLRVYLLRERCTLSESLNSLSLIPAELPLHLAFERWVKHLLAPDTYEKPEMEMYFSLSLFRFFEDVSSQSIPDLSFDFEGGKIRLGQQPPIDLSNRPALVVFLRLLLKARESSDASVSALELFKAAWPDIRILSKNGIRRVYTEIHRLRKLGIDIEQTKDGYRFPEKWHIVVKTL